MHKIILILLIGILSIYQGNTQNNPPIAVTDTISVIPGSLVYFNPILNDYDIENDSIYLFHCISGKYCNILVIGDSTIEIDVFNHAIGTEMVTYFIADKMSTTNLSTGNIHIKYLNFNNCDSLTINSVNAHFSSIGNQFWDLNSKSTFEVPRNSGKTTIYTSSPWLGGKDDFGIIRLAAEKYQYDGSDYFAGPIRNQSLNQAQQKIQWNKLWKISKYEIEFHKLMYWTPGYKPIFSIANWPAMGDTTLGQNQFLAPFIDVDNDGIYNPMNGDYPQIKGDQAIYMIFNDATQPNMETGGLSLGIEIHQMAYAYFCPFDSAIDQTIFINYKIFNRSSFNYTDWYFGQFSDLDIGYPNDDYIGCDTVRNYYYAYNGKPIDGNNTPDAYGNYPPMQAVKFLSHKMNHFIRFINSSSIIGDPTGDQGCYNFLQSKFNNTTPLTYGGDGINGTVPTNFMYPDDPRDTTGWSCIKTQPTDQRGLASIGPISFPSGTMFSVDLAYIFARQTHSNYLNTKDLLDNYADKIQMIYDTDSIICQNQNTEIVSYESEMKRIIKLFPNPADEYIFVEINKITNPTSYLILNSHGAKVQEGIIQNTGIKKIELNNLPKGIYLILFTDNQKVESMKFIIQ